MQITKLHYFPFLIDTFAPWNEETIQSKNFEMKIESVPKQQMNLILGMLTLRLCRGRFQRVVKLRAELDGGKKIILVDGSGCVKLGSNEYYLYPSSLLYLEQDLQRIMKLQNPDFPSPSAKPQGVKG